MSKKNVLITGVQKGIGAKTAEYFFQNDWQVLGVGKREKKDEQRYFTQYYQADVSNPTDWSKISDDLAFSGITIDAIVNNAAVQISKPIVETSIEEWNTTISVNLGSIFLSSKYLYNHMNEGSSIVNVSSVHSVATSEKIGVYAASKGAILSLTRAMAIEFGLKKIRVNAVLPGAIRTDMLIEGLNRNKVDTMNTNDLLCNLEGRHILQRIGTPDDVAHIIYFLSDSYQSSFITGGCYVIDGGALARLSTEC